MKQNENRLWILAGVGLSFIQVAHYTSEPPTAQASERQAAREFRFQLSALPDL